MAQETASTAVTPAKFGFKYKVTWGIAALGTSFISGTFAALLTIFYQDYLGVGAKWIAIASAVYAVWNAFNDPIFGYITDSTRSKHGRRIPYMRFTAPFLALSFILVWLAPKGAGNTVLFWWMLGSMVFYDGCYTIIGLVYSALLPEITESDEERNGLQISSSLFGLLGMLLGFIVPDMVRPKGDATSILPLQISMVIVALFSMACILLTASKVKERPEFTKVDKPIALGPSLKFTFTSKSFLILVAQNFMSILMSSLVMAMIYYLADYVLKMNTMIVLAFLFIPLLIGVPITNVLRKKLGVSGAQQLLLLIAGVGLIAMAFVPTSLMLPCIALAGFGLSGPQTLTNVLFAQVADEDETRSGVRREGAFFGVNALLTKPAQSIAIALIPWILEINKFVTRDANGGQIFLNQPANAIFGIKMLIGFIPGVAMILGAIILFWYPLQGKHLEEIKAKVMEMHIEKAAQLEKMG
jgi:GPH family glycoside/pentoside/hexuronide:cation symporter